MGVVQEIETNLAAFGGIIILAIGVLIVFIFLCSFLFAVTKYIYKKTTEGSE